MSLNIITVLIACLLLSNSLLVSENTLYEAPIIQPGAPGENSKVLDPSVASNIARSWLCRCRCEFFKRNGHSSSTSYVHV